MKKLFLLFAVLFGSACMLMAEETAPKWLMEKFGDKLVDAKGKEVPVSTLKDKTIGVYFSAHWCPPCRQFTPMLVKFRDKNKKKFEVVFVSCDQDEKAMKGYMTETEMKWPALPFKGTKANALGAEFHVGGIPTLIILDKNGNLVTANGRGDVTSNPKDALKKWKSAAKKAVDADKD